MGTQTLWQGNVTLDVHFLPPFGVTLETREVDDKIGYFVRYWVTPPNEPGIDRLVINDQRARMINFIQQNPQPNQRKFTQALGKTAFCDIRQKDGITYANLHPVKKGSVEASLVWACLPLAKDDHYEVIHFDPLVYTERSFVNDRACWSFLAVTNTDNSFAINVYKKNQPEPIPFLRPEPKP